MSPGQSVTESRGGDKWGSAPAVTPSRVSCMCAGSALTPCHSSFQVSTGTSGGWDFLSFTLSLPSVAVQRLPGCVCCCNLAGAAALQRLVQTPGDVISTGGLIVLVGTPTALWNVLFSQ